MSIDEAEGLRWDGQLLLRIIGARARALGQALVGRTFAGFLTSRLFPVRPAVLEEDGVQTEWLLLSPRPDSIHEMVSRNPWDMAHTVQRDAVGFLQLRGDHGESAYVEPNLFHRIYWPRSKTTAATGSWPTGPDFAWHLERDYTDLRRARNSPRSNADRENARVGILDTGIPAAPHEALPAKLEANLGWNFADNCLDVHDSGIGLNPGHGTATLGILAGDVGGVRRNGRPYGDFTGGAPLSHVVPVRVASAVVLFKTVELARSIEHIAHLGQTRNAPCQVISISMGGLASEAWADAVNDAYDQGVCVVAAAGNNVAKLPTRFTVYPSRFGRVITVTGVTAAQEPYTTGNPFVMQGNYGPPSVMTKAIAAYTPNMMHALFDPVMKPVPIYWNETFEGTSAATPQVAAAAALWFERHADQYAEPWRKIEAVRAALFFSARKTHKNYKTYFGNGTLHAAEALSPATQDHVRSLVLAKRPRDRVKFPFLRVLLGWDQAVASDLSDAGARQMLEAEAINLVIERGDESLQGTVGDREDFEAIDRPDQARRIRDLGASAEISNDLRNALANIR